MLAALGALTMESLVMILFTSPGLTGVLTDPNWFMPVGVIIEEFFALVLIGKLFQNSPDKQHLFSRALFFGVGFSVPEILLNAANSSALSGEIFSAYPGLLLIHTASAGIFGCYFSRQISVRPAIIFFFLFAVFSHLLFNFLILSFTASFLTLGLPLLVIFACFIALKAHPWKNSLPRREN